MSDARYWQVKGRSDMLLLSADRKAICIGDIYRNGLVLGRNRSALRFIVCLWHFLPDWSDNTELKLEVLASGRHQTWNWQAIKLLLQSNCSHEDAYLQPILHIHGINNFAMILKCSKRVVVQAFPIFTLLIRRYWHNIKIHLEEYDNVKEFYGNKIWKKQNISNSTVIIN